MVNEYSFEIESIFVMRVCVIKRVRADLYGTPCTLGTMESFNPFKGMEMGGIKMNIFTTLQSFSS